MILHCLNKNSETTNRIHNLIPTITDEVSNPAMRAFETAGNTPNRIKVNGKKFKEIYNEENLRKFKNVL